MNGIKYAGKTIIEIAQERGSAAKTNAGAWKYLLANLPKPAKHEPRYNSRKWDWDRYRQARMERRADGRALILGYSLDDPNTPGRILATAWEMNSKWDADCRTAIERDSYGACYYNSAASQATRPRPEVAGWDAAWSLIREAAHKNVIPAQHDGIEWDRKGRADGNALHHDLYDFRRSAAIICIRRTEGTRYGVKTLSKTYILIEVIRRKITAREIAIPVAKYAKMAILHYGDIIAVAKGERKITLLSSIHQIRHGYKAVRVNDDGTLASVWDGSPWEIGKTRVEAARGDHDGGLYYYQDLRALLSAVKTADVFGTGSDHHRLAILEVEATGAHVQYGCKFAATRITPIRQIAATI